MHVEACGLYSCPPSIARDKATAQSRNTRGLGLWVTPSVLPHTCPYEPEVVLVCDILWRRPKGSRALSLDLDSSRRMVLGGQGIALSSQSAGETQCSPGLEGTEKGSLMHGVPRGWAVSSAPLKGREVGKEGNHWS